MPAWFLCKIRYRKEAENGKQITINESYLVDSVSFTDAETRIYKELESIVKDFTLTSVSQMKVADVFHYEDAETWFKCKVQYISLDEKSGKEKKIQNLMLITAENVKQAYERIEESLKTMLVPFDITDINITNIIEIFPYYADEPKIPANFRPLSEVKEEAEVE